MSQDKLFENKNAGPVSCLGMTFESDEARRSYFTEKLREKLKDPEFRKIEGFPIGKDEDILALSDPPYYTACPNPFVGKFFKLYGKPYDAGNDNYRREPFAADVSEGKRDPLYEHYSYHTKVPYQAVARYIAHFTNYGDIVIDAFSGSGMTGLASNYLSSVASSSEDKGRLTLLNDISTYAGFIGHHFSGRKLPRK